MPEARGLSVRSLVVTAVSVAVSASIGFSASVEVGVSTRPEFFNPTVGQRAEIALKGPQRVQVRVEVVDRDGFPVRDLGEVALENEAKLEWDGT